MTTVIPFIFFLPILSYTNDRIAILNGIKKANLLIERIDKINRANNIDTGVFDLKMTMREI